MKGDSHMKRMICLLLCAVFLMSLSGCTQEPPETETTAPADPTESTGDTGVVITVGEEYEERQVAGLAEPQKGGVLLITRSDGTVDYIFCNRTQDEIESEGISSVRETWYQYYTVRQDGTAEKCSADWMFQLDEVMTTVNPQGSGAKWWLDFTAWEGNILILAQLRSEEDDTTQYMALYHLYEDVLTQIPFRWEEGYGELAELHAVENGFLVWTNRGGGHLYSYDGTLTAELNEELAYQDFLCAGGRVGWFQGSDRRIRAYDLFDGTKLADVPCEGGKSIRCAAASPDGSALYVLSNVYGKTRTKLERVTENGVEKLTNNLGRYIFDVIDNVPIFMAVANDGTLYTITQSSAGTRYEDIIGIRGIMLLRYRPMEEGSTP